MITDRAKLLKEIQAGTSSGTGVFLALKKDRLKTKGFSSH